MKVVVIGGSGLIGSKLVNKLREHGHEVVAASATSGVNTLTGEGRFSSCLPCISGLSSAARHPSVPMWKAPDETGTLRSEPFHSMGPCCTRGALNTTGFSVPKPKPKYETRVACGFSRLARIAGCIAIRAVVGET
jgi:hypothetical protein